MLTEVAKATASIASIGLGITICSLAINRVLRVPTIKEKLVEEQLKPFDGEWKHKFAYLKKLRGIDSLIDAWKELNPDKEYDKDITDEEGGKMIEEWCASVLKEKSTLRHGYKNLDNAKQWCFNYRIFK
ncbi:hypothetical protein HF1_06560 [Mycoplasma haemofelis str. Langford 1]|uniref:Uncharacterized protein n=2 Tax=Mycoplasma haemofelis TaxID=29501 RepID=F6FIF0_MYCHI|nr:hypothetical protein [Mycoplasma haemofelis]AEG72998.1 hypothetical protein MHF_0728 [Mycoplasma haemofelis Ohio2]CBY92664.1 hypothetical protein HF1_06560 [Mycoplasma haemofelis str. Langford 1]